VVYRPDIDGLRAVAVLAVVAFHAFPETLPGGFIGVDVFFVISGYLITGLILAGKAANTFTFADFYVRRARRLLPALAIVLASSFLAGWLFLSNAAILYLCRHVLASVTFSLNFILAGEINYFALEATHKPLLHLWSLAVEEQFYLVWPAAIVLMWRRRLALIGTAAAVSFALALWQTDHAHGGAYFLPTTRFWELLVGAALAHGSPVPAARRDFYSAIGMIMIVAASLLYSAGDDYPGWRAALPVAGTALVIASGPGGAVNRFLANAPLVLIGRISYPLYLWHWPILSIASAINLYSPLDADVRAALMLASAVLAWLTYRLVETPIRMRSLAVTRHVSGAFASLGALAMALPALGIVRLTTQSEAQALIDSYEHFYHGDAMNDLFQQRCNFYDGTTTKNRGAVDPACTAVRGDRPSFLLWGDSHAQALWFGMRAISTDAADMNIVATSGCSPEIHQSPSNGADKEACRLSNELAMRTIVANRPARVFVAQRRGHESVDWVAISRFVRANGGELVLIGPTPQWLPSLPAVVAKDLHGGARYIGEGLDPNVMRTNEILRYRFSGGEIRYVSLIDSLCRHGKCLARVDGAAPLDLLVMDYGHLMPAGSRLVATTLLQDLLRPPN